jgi:hypothetical protein
MDLSFLNSGNIHLVRQIIAHFMPTPERPKEGAGYLSVFKQKK